MNMLRHIPLLLVLACWVDAAYGQNTWHVDDDCAPPGAGTEVDPFCTIQQGIDAASDGDMVLVGPGIYTGDGNRDMSLFGKLITLKSTLGPQDTIIDVQGGPDAIHRAFFLIHGETPESVIEGLTVKNAYLIGDTGGTGPGGGGGGAIYIRDSSPMIRNCNIRENVSATLNPPFPVDGRGAGIYIDGNSHAVIEHCIIADNWADRRGGGMYIGYDHSTVTIRNCLVARNTNAPIYSGGGIYLTFGSAIITNTDILNNANESFAGGFYNEGGEAFLHNCVVWGNSAIVGTQIYVDGFALLTTEYSDIQEGLAGVEGPGEIIWGEGMIDADPQFVDPENGDFRISAGSPCIDAGNNWAMSSGFITDLDGLARFAEDPATTDTGVAAWGMGVVDMGAYEFGGDDCNGNGTPDVEDIANGDSADCTANNIPDECEPDCNGSGQADSCDIADGSSTDCDHDGRPDECQIEIDSPVPGGPFYCDPTLQTCDLDCNANGVPDACDISSGEDQDCGVDGIPDDCPENPGPVITAQPVSQEVEAGDVVFFAVAANGVQLEYQWRKDGVELEDDDHIVGSQTMFLGILVTPEDAGSYDCEVTDFSGACALSNPAILTVTDPCPADFDDDGAVGSFDLAILLGNWGPCPDPDACPADLNNDGAVEAFDLAQLLGAWGPCP